MQVIEQQYRPTPRSHRMSINSSYEDIMKIVKDADNERDKAKKEKLNKKIQSLKKQCKAVGTRRG